MLSEKEIEHITQHINQAAGDKERLLAIIDQLATLRFRAMAHLHQLESRKHRGPFNPATGHIGR